MFSAPPLPHIRGDVRSVMECAGGHLFSEHFESVARFQFGMSQCLFPADYQALADSVVLSGPKVQPSGFLVTPGLLLTGWQK